MRLFKDAARLRYLDKGAELFPPSRSSSRPGCRQARSTSGGSTAGLRITVVANPQGTIAPLALRNQLSCQWNLLGPLKGAYQQYSGLWRGRFACVAAPAVAMPESDLEVMAMLSRATERVGLEWRKPPCPEPSRLDDWFLGVACAGSQCPALGASLPDVHEELTCRGRHLLLPETDLLTPPPSPPSVVQLGVTGVPLVERSVAMQVCPHTVSTRQGKPCLLFRACRYSSGLIRRGLCGLWRCCLHLMLRRYCRFFRLKALRDMHGGGHDPEVLKELRTAPDLVPRATKVMAQSLGRAMSTLVVQERHLWLCLVDIGTPTKFGSSRFLYPRLASSATQPVTWPSSFRLHRSRLRRSNTSCLGGQLLPPPVRRLQRPTCSSPRAAPCIQPRSRTASAAASKSSAVELGVGRPPRPSWPPSTGGKRRSKRPRDGRPRERGNCFGRG